MSHITITKQLCGILDNNIQIDVPEGMTLLPIEKYQDVNYIVFESVLTYKPKACTQCGLKNTGSHDLIKHGFKPTIIRLPNLVSNPLIAKTEEATILL